MECDNPSESAPAPGHKRKDNKSTESYGVSSIDTLYELC